MSETINVLPRPSPTDRGPGTLATGIVLLEHGGYAPRPGWFCF